MKMTTKTAAAGRGRPRRSDAGEELPLQLLADLLEDGVLLEELVLSVRANDPKA